MVEFDFRKSAEIFISTGQRGMRGRVAYHRFSTAAEAIRYAVETLSSSALLRVVLESDELRFNGHQIRNLYEQDGYPLIRAKLA